MATYGNPIVASPNMLPSTADVFSASTAYSAGDYVWYNGKLYCFTADHAAGAWTGSDAAAAKLANDVADLKSAITQYDSYVVGVTNLMDGVSYTSGYYIAANGTITASSGFRYSDLIPVTPGEYTFVDTKTGSSDMRVRIHAYANDESWVKQIAEYPQPTAGEYHNLFSVEDGTAYIRISVDSTIGSIWLFAGKSLTDEIADTNTAIGTAVKTVSETDDDITTKQKSALSANVIKPDGSTLTASSQVHETVSVHPGDIVSVKNYYILSNGDPVIKRDVLISAVCAMKSGTPVSAKGKSYNASLASYTVPDDIDSVTVSFSGTPYGATYNLFDIVVATPVENYYLVQPQFGNPLRWTGDIAANETKWLGELYCVDNALAVFTGHLGNALGDDDEIVVGDYDGSTMTKPKVTITATKVIVEADGNASLDREYSHGLTIDDDLQVIIQYDKSLKQKIIVQSCGDRWTSPNDDVQMGLAANGFGISSTVAMTDCDFAVSIRDLNKPVWVCGDSWVTNYDTRWYGQALALGFADVLKSGFAGQGSYSALQRLMALLSINRPKVIVWMLGMNDADTDNSTVNPYWKEAVDYLIDYCENNTITLVLATIPTTPTRNNNAKNAYVVASGYRYVDQVKAMGADTSGNWISGYQSEDGNHTTEAGAKALLARVLADCPEISLT